MVAETAGKSGGGVWVKDYLWLQGRYRFSYGVVVEGLYVFTLVEVNGFGVGEEGVWDVGRVLGEGVGS